MYALPILTDTAKKVPGPAQGHWTYAYWEQLPDDGNRYEIIDGFLYMTTAPAPMHQWAGQHLFALFGFPAERQGIGFSFLAPIGVIMPGCDPVQPDFVFIRRENAAIIGKKRIDGVPDLVAEVLSPGSVDYDEGIKLEAYARAGVPEYVVLDAQSRVLRHYRLEAPGKYGSPRQFAEGQTVTFGCAPSIQIQVADLFGGAPDSAV